MMRAGLRERKSMASFKHDALRRRAWELFLSVGVIFLVSYTWMFTDISVPNERSRVYLAVAMVDGQTVQIDEPLDRWGKIYDLAEREGHFYSDKAPGSSVLGAVLYGVARLFTDPAEWTIGELINLFRTWLMIPLMLLGFLFLRRILEFLGLDPPVIDVASLGWALGTAAFHYGGAYFGHQIVSVCLLGSFYCVTRAEGIGLSGGTRGIAAWMVAAGAFAGLAGMTEYQAIVVCALLTGYVLAANRNTRRAGLLPFLAGAAPFGAGLLLYNALAFGGPFELSYHYLADEGLREIHGQGIAGVTMPKWEYFFGSMFSLHRGLFSTSPMFLLLFPGLYFMWRQGWRRLTLLVAATFLYFVAFVSSSNMWFAGWGFGPRLLVPAMGIWAIAVAAGLQSATKFSWSEGFAKGLFVVGVLTHQLVVAFFPEPPDSTHNPLVDVVPLMWDEGITSPNLGKTLFGLESLSSLIPLAVVVAVMLAVVIGRGLRLYRNRSSFIIITLSIAAVLGTWALVVTNVGPTWTSRQETKWVKFLDRWQAREPNS